MVRGVSRGLDVRQGWRFETQPTLENLYQPSMAGRRSEYAGRTASKNPIFALSDSSTTSSMGEDDDSNRNKIQEVQHDEERARLIEENGIPVKVATDTP